MLINDEFYYRGLSATELDEMIYWYKVHRIDDIITENARLRQALRMMEYRQQMEEARSLFIVKDDTWQ